MTRSLTPLCILGAGLLFACSAGTSLPVHELQGHSMGTSFHITVVDPVPGTSLDQLSLRINESLERIENVASTYRDTSDLGKFNLNKSTDWISVSGELCAMVASAVTIGRETGGAFDITMGPLVNLWGFGPGEMLGAPPPEAAIEAARVAVGLDKLNVDCERSRLRKSVASLRIDLSGWAKGYAVDQLADLLDSMGLANYLVELGGELRVKGHNAAHLPFAIAIEKPEETGSNELTIIHVTNTGVATSGDYRNFFEYDGVHYSHTLDPTTLRPVTHSLSAVTVIHPSTAHADAMATALLVLGPTNGMQLADSQGLAALFAVSTAEGLKYLHSKAFAAGNFLGR